MTRRLIVVLVMVAASAAVLAAPAEATPPRPPQPPGAYVQTAAYNNGCTDWFLQSTYPMSPAAPQWVFTCQSFDGYLYAEDRYYWNADRQTVILYEQTVWDDGFDWYTDCTLYRYGACPA
jgi:hypothetical protein